MKRKTTSVLVIALLLATFVAPAASEAAQPAAIPAARTAVAAGPAVIPLGTAWNHDGRLVEGYAIVHFGRTTGGPPASPETADAKGGRPARGDTALYAFIASGARWRSTEPCVVNASNASGVLPQDVTDTVSASMAAWEAEAGSDIFGPISTTTALLEAEGSGDMPDSRNELLFEELGSTGVIAYASVWGIWKGRPSEREIVECDIVFNDSESWGDAGATDENNPAGVGFFDLLNIATHEVGHGAGLADLYTDAASEQSMYGYSRHGETKKRTLNTGDVAGIKQLYGQ